MEKFRNKYRISSARAPWWDYSWDALYFVTICTGNREFYFGDVIYGRNGLNEMKLSGIGEIANDCWKKIPEHFPFVKLDAFVIMPNHIHGILFIEKPDAIGSTVIVETQNIASLPPVNRSNVNVETQNIASLRPVNRSNVNVETQNIASLRPVNRSNVNVETQNIASLPPETRHSLNQFGPQSKNLGSVIRGFKTGVTIRSRQIDPGFSWQTRYYDHIIRNEQSYKAISEYIINNPINWKDDKLFDDKKQI